MQRYQAAPRKQAGFTLVEIAIVLVIIGLLLGGVLKGQELITQAKIKNVSNDLNGIVAAVYGYQDRYKRLPGDDAGMSRWTIGGTAVTGGDNNNVIDGGYESTDDSKESRKFWLALRMAGFVGGATTSISEASTQPLNAAGGILGVQSGALGLPGPVICASGLPAKIAQALDSQMDDGKLLSGSIRGQLDTTPPTTPVGAAALPSSTADYQDDGVKLYVICKTI